MALFPFAPDVWRYTHDMALGPGVHLPCASTVMRLSDDSLAIVSPGPVHDDDVQAISDLGSVSWLLAPNLFHHLHLRPAQEAFGAAIAGPVGLVEKRKGLTIDHVYGKEELDPSLDILAIGGMPRVQEHVFFHRPSKTLVTTDLVFNMQDHTGPLSGLVFRMMGTHQGLSSSRLSGLLMSDKQAFADRLGPLVDLDITGLIMAHGEPVASEGGAALRKALRTRFSAMLPA